MDNEALNEELLEAEETVEQPEQAPRRNSKQSLIDKILELSERDNIPLEHSNTKLKRMNKQQLAQLCADMIEKGLRKKMAQTVGASDDSERSICLGALRMLHDVCAVGVEKASDHFLGDYGYTVEGFSGNLKEPTVSKSIDLCLEEIARENTELLEYIQSPYTRLMIAWGGAMAFSCRKQQRRSNVTDLGPRPPQRKNPIRMRRRRGPSDGKIDVSDASLAPVQEV